jgi:hypothetical protein
MQGRNPSKTKTKNQKETYKMNATPHHPLTREEMLNEVREMEGRFDSLTTQEQNRFRSICLTYGTKFGPISKDI